MKIKKMLLSVLVIILIFGGALSVNTLAVTDYEYIYLSQDYMVTEDGWRVSMDAFYKGDIVGYEGELESVTIPTEINGEPVGDIFIINNTKLKEVIVPDYFSNKRIVFHGSKALTSVKLPSNKGFIEKYAFFACVNLIRVEMPNDLKFIGSFAFAGCKNLKEIGLPDSIETLGSFAFQACSSLENITIPKNCKKIGNSIFEECTNLKVISILSETITAVYENPSEIIEGIEESKTETENALPEKFAYGCTSLKSINLPESTKFIGESAFQNSGLTSITIPKNVKTIYKNAFKGCENLTSVKFAGAVNNIGKSAFSKCVNLKTVNFTKGYLKKVYDYAFYKCEKLEKITISNTKNVPTIAKSAFNKAKSGIKFYVKNNTVAKKLKAKLQKTNIKKAKIYRSAPILIYKNVG